MVGFNRQTDLINNLAYKLSYPQYLSNLDKKKKKKKNIRNNTLILDLFID